MNYKLWILIIAWVVIVLVLILGYLGFDLISIVSNSMKHEDEALFAKFWEDRDCGPECLKEFPVSEGFQGGDLLILKKTADYKTGDILAYQANCICADNGKCKCADIIIHRLVDLNETTVFLTGDNLKIFAGDIYYMEDGTKEDFVIVDEVERKFVNGKIIFKIPKLGLVKALINCWAKECNFIDCITNGNCN